MRAAGLAVLLAGAALVGAGRAQAMQCPAAGPGAGAIPLNAAEWAELETAVTHNDFRNQVASRTVDLRRRFPGVDGAKIMDLFLRAYCPSVAQLLGLSDAEQQARLDRFRSQISPLVYPVK
jgi:hypothetical protein